MKEYMCAWVEDQLGEAEELEDGSYLWRDRVFDSLDSLNDALWSAEMMAEVTGNLIDNAMNTMGGYR